MIGYKKVGGLHFFKVGRFGASFYVSKAAPKERKALPDTFAIDGLLVVLVASIGSALVV